MRLEKEKRPYKIGLSRGYIHIFRGRGDFMSNGEFDDGEHSYGTRYIISRLIFEPYHAFLFLPKRKDFIRFWKKRWEHDEA